MSCIIWRHILTLFNYNKHHTVIKNGSASINTDQSVGIKLVSIKHIEVYKIAVWLSIPEDTGNYPSGLRFLLEQVLSDNRIRANGLSWGPMLITFFYMVLTTMLPLTADSSSKVYMRVLAGDVYVYGPPPVTTSLVSLLQTALGRLIPRL